jgi:mannose-1-phosphate guanylyltransferase
MQLYALIMAGGVGTRLWPRSNRDHPKQFLRLTGDWTMIQDAQRRLLPLIAPEQVVVATNQEYVANVSEQLPAVPTINILGEPAGRGTAAAIGYAAIHLRQRAPEAVMAVVTADHVIQDTDRFRASLAAAATVAQDGWLVTLGIHPTYPETGYGYIERGAPLPAVDDFEVFEVARFTEKPDRQTAEQLVSSGRYTWNSGMFVWRVDRILAEIEQHMPELYAGLLRIEGALGNADAEAELREVWLSLPNQTIDYGIMEKAAKVAVLPVEFGWSDVGSWASVYDLLPRDELDNAVTGQHISPDSRGNLIYSPNRVVATLGLEDMVVIDTDDVLLICPRSRSQEVKLLVELSKAQRKAADEPEKS